MDQIDTKILQILSENAAATATEMVPLVNLSIPAINKRIQKMQKSGVIRKFSVVVDPEKVGKPVCAYILVVLQQGVGMENLMKLVRRDPDILECYGITGDYDYLLKVCTGDMSALQKKINQLKQEGSVVKSHTMLSMTEYKHVVSVLPDTIKEREKQ